MADTRDDALAGDDAEPAIDRTIRLGLDDDERPRAAELYYAAFEALLRPILGEPARALPLLADALDRELALVARAADGRLVGLCGLHIDDRHLVDLRIAAVLRAFGPLDGARRVLVGLLLAASPAPGELLIDGIAVDPRVRGRGVARRLLDELARIAAARGLRAIRVDVADTNLAARRLYEGCAFVAGETRRSALRRRIFGFAAATTMRRAITATE
ncbi:MAG: GNAT family N-acetyltransferase [Myxococcales bacterium]|nr:GNAT family N-acetyltransferase [Myxococcales bacterium]